MSACVQVDNVRKGAQRRLCQALLFHHANGPHGPPHQGGGQGHGGAGLEEGF